MRGNQRIIGVAVTATLMLVQLSGTLCGLACASAPAAATSPHHHEAAHAAHASTDGSTGLAMLGVAEHDCRNHDAVVQQASTAAVDRAHVQSRSAMAASSAAQDIIATQRSSRVVQGRAPPGAAPRTATPLVLRI